MIDTLVTAARQINEGDLVKVCYPMTDKTNNPARILDGEEFVVKSKHKASNFKGGDTYVYTLYGAASKAGVPYSFLTDELIKL